MEVINYRNVEGRRATVPYHSGKNTSSETLKKHNKRIGYYSGRIKKAFEMKINHLGIATKSIEEALKFWEGALGLENVHTEIVEDQKVRIAMLPIGESRVELLEPTSDDSPISKFLEKRGGGIHHIAIEVDDIEAALAKLKSEGMRLIDETPRIGAEGCLVAFVHPASANGVLLELVQTT